MEFYQHPEAPRGPSPCIQVIIPFVMITTTLCSFSSLCSIVSHYMICHNLFLYSTAGRYLGCICFLAVVKGATMKTVLNIFWLLFACISIRCTDLGVMLLLSFSKDYYFRSDYINSYFSQKIMKHILIKTSVFSATL